MRVRPRRPPSLAARSDRRVWSTFASSPPLAPPERQHSDRDDPPWDAARLLEEALRRRSDGHSTSDLIRELVDRMDPPYFGAASSSESVRDDCGDDDAEAPLESRALRQLSARPVRSEGVSSDVSTTPVAIPNHTLLRMIGHGGFGQVWIAHNPHTDHHRACKLVPRDRMLELEGLRRLKQRVPAHPNLMPVEEVGVVDGWLYCLMPLAENAHSAGSRLDVGGYEATTLRLALERRGPMPPAECAAIGAELAAALSHLHVHGVTHGDVKPTNVLRLDGRWTLADYGLARDLSKPVGGGETRDYTPPEGPGSPKADQFALGVVLFELATGLRRNGLESFRSGSPSKPVRSAAGRALHDAIRTATAPAPDARFGSMRELSAALERVAVRRTRRFWIATVATLVVVVLLALTLGESWFSRWTADRTGPSTSDAPARGPGRADGASATPVETTVSTPVIVRFDVRQTRFDGTDDRILGLLGRDSGAARIDDDLAVEAEFSAPAFAYLLSLDTAGTAELREPSSTSLAPDSAGEIHFPATPELAFRLTAGPGAQGFLLLASREPLPAWNEFAAAHGKPPWTPMNLDDEGVWAFDGHSLVVEGATRGEVLPRRGGAPPVVALIEWIESLPGIDAVRLVVFPVRE